MGMSNKERHILKELAREYAEVAALDIQQENMIRMRDNNDLKPGRPPVLIAEIPWHEMDIDNQLKNICTHQFAKNMETFFRRKLFQWKYFPGDMVVEAFYPINKTSYSTGYGMEVKENLATTDVSNHIVSHEYIDQLSTDDDLEKLHCPVITRDEEADKRNIELAQEVLGDILPVKLRGSYI